MSTAVWPPIDGAQLEDAQLQAQRRELQWLLAQLTETLRALKAGLEECAVLLAPTEKGSTLVLSSLRSESVKGVVTRVGTRIVKGSVKLRLASLPPPRGAATFDLALSAAPTAPALVVSQLSAVRTAINCALDALDAVAWAGDASDAGFVSGQLLLLHDHLREARQALHGTAPQQPSWWTHPVDPHTFEPPLPPSLAFHLFVADAALCLELRTLEPKPDDDAAIASSFTGFSLRDRLSSALGAARPPPHDEADATYTYNGRQVRVKEKIRVETQDPALISAAAKLNALEHTLQLTRNALTTLMGDDP